MGDKKDNKNRDDQNEDMLESGWAGPGIEIWPEEDDYVMWRSMNKDPRRHLECSIPELAASPFCGRISTMASADFNRRPD